MGGDGAVLPGDITPPSRFVHTVVFSQGAAPASSAQQAALNLFHILNNFDIPYGVTQPAKGTSESNADYTSWTTVADLQNPESAPGPGGLHRRSTAAAADGPPRPTNRSPATVVTVP